MDAFALAHLAHDLRDPLSTIRMAAGMLLLEIERPAPGAVGQVDAPTAPSPDTVRRYLGYIGRAAIRMEQLTDRLLQDAYRNGDHPVPLALVATAPAMLVRDACDALTVPAQGKGVTVVADVADDLPHVRCDRVRLQQVLANLCGNAVKFTPQGGRVRVGARRAPPPDAAVEFTVEDTGPGVAHADRARVFDRHWRAPQTGVTGHGLGLAIAREVVRAHGGHLWLEAAAPGRGAAFSFHIALAEQPGPGA